MSLSGFKARNHPQQIASGGVDMAVDDRGTDPAFFAEMEARFGKFDLDVAAAAHNAKCEDYFTVEDNGLIQLWDGHRIWCNPPYSNLRAWVEKAWLEMVRGDGPDLIVMLLPANRTEQRWWHEFVEPERDKGKTFQVEFLRGRMRFVRPNWNPGPKGDRPPFGCCLLIWRRPEDPVVTPGVGRFSVAGGRS